MLRIKIHLNRLQIIHKLLCDVCVVQINNRFFFLQPFEILVNQSYFCRERIGLISVVSFADKNVKRTRLHNKIPVKWSA